MQRRCRCCGARACHRRHSLSSGVSSGHSPSSGLTGFAFCLFLPLHPPGATLDARDLGRGATPSRSHSPAKGKRFLLSLLPRSFPPTSATWWCRMECQIYGCTAALAFGLGFLGYFEPRSQHLRISRVVTPPPARCHAHRRPLMPCHSSTNYSSDDLGQPHLSHLNPRRVSGFQTPEGSKAGSYEWVMVFGYRRRFSPRTMSSFPECTHTAQLQVELSAEASGFRARPRSPSAPAGIGGTCRLPRCRYQAGVAGPCLAHVPRFHAARGVDSHHLFVRSLLWRTPPSDGR